MSHDHNHGHDHEHTHHHSHGQTVPWNASTAQWYEPGWSDPVLRRLITVAHAGAGDVVVDVDCGDGKALCTAAAWVSRGRLVGVSSDVEAAKARAAGHPDSDRLSFHAGTPEQLPVADGLASVAWSSGSLGRWRDPAQCVAELHRVLRPGGSLMIIADPIGDDPTSPAALKALLRSSGFRAVEVRRYRDGETRSVLFMAGRG